MLGKLIVIEGTDGAGKSTQVELIKKYLDKNNLSHAYFHFPMYGHNTFSNVITKLLQGDFGEANQIDPYFAATNYGMDRFSFKGSLNKALEENDIVILDRYVFSNMAYQSARLEGTEKQEMIDWIFKFEFDFLELQYPDLNIFLDIPISVTKDRLKAKKEGQDKASLANRSYLDGKEDIFEKDLDFQRKIRDTYLTLKKPNYEIVQCSGISGDFGDCHRYILSPETLFNSYIHLILDVIEK